MMLLPADEGLKWQLCDGRVGRVVSHHGYQTRFYCILMDYVFSLNITCRVAVAFHPKQFIILIAGTVPVLIVMAVIEPATFLLAVQIINYKSALLCFLFALTWYLLSLVSLYVQPPKRSCSEIGFNLLTSLCILFIKVSFQQISPVCSCFHSNFREGQCWCHVVL